MESEEDSTFLYGQSELEESIDSLDESISALKLIRVMDAILHILRAVDPKSKNEMAFSEDAKALVNNFLSDDAVMSFVMKISELTHDIEFQDIQANMKDKVEIFSAHANKLSVKYNIPLLKKWSSSNQDNPAWRGFFSSIGQDSDRLHQKR